MTNTFGKSNKFGIKEDTRYFESIKLVYAEESNGSGAAGKAWAGVKSVPYATANYACHHPYKVAAFFALVTLAVAGTFAYFASAAYAAYVIAAGAKAAALVSPAVTAVSAFLVANPLIASLIIAASVVALVAAPVYAYMNSSKASQIEEAGKLLNDSDPASKINQIKEVLGFGKAQSVQ